MTPSQAEVLAYLEERFGVPGDLAVQVEKLREEFFELHEAFLGVQGHFGGYAPAEGWEQNLQDETADVVTVCMGIAAVQGFDLWEAVASKWDRRKRGGVTEW